MQKYYIKLIYSFFLAKVFRCFFKSFSMRFATFLLSFLLHYSLLILDYILRKMINRKFHHLNIFCWDFNIISILSLYFPFDFSPLPFDLFFLLHSIRKHSPLFIVLIPSVIFLSQHSMVIILFLIYLLLFPLLYNCKRKTWNCIREVRLSFPSFILNQCIQNGSFLHLKQTQI